MGIGHLWDTNTVIYFLQGQFSASAEEFIDHILEHFSPAISVITEIELLCWKTARERDLEVLHDFIKEITVFELDGPIKFETIKIRRSHGVKIPDAIIAATALVHGLTLIYSCQMKTRIFIMLSLSHTSLKF